MTKVYRSYLDTKKIKKLLIENKISQKEIARILKTDYSSLSLAIAGSVTVSKKHAEKIAEILNVSPEDIIKLSVVQNTTYIHIDEKLKWDKEYFIKSLHNADMTITELSKRAGIRANMIYKYNDKTSSPSIDTAAKIIAVLNCDAKQLLGFTEQELNELAGGIWEQLKQATPGNIMNNAFGSSIIKHETNNEKYIAPFEHGNTEHKKETKNTDEIITDQKNKMPYKHFTGNNVLENINCINENVLTMANEMQDYINKLEKQLYEIKQALSDSEKRQDKMQVVITNLISHIENNPMQTDNADTVALDETVVQSNTQTDSFEGYKQKIYKLVTFISKKKNLIFNQIMHDCYKKFLKVYGIDCTQLKKETKAEGPLQAVYGNELYREIFFNMVCDMANECK